MSDINCHHKIVTKYVKIMPAGVTLRRVSQKTYLPILTRLRKNLPKIFWYALFFSLSISLTARVIMEFPGRQFGVSFMKRESPFTIWHYTHLDRAGEEAIFVVHTFCVTGAHAPACSRFFVC